MNPRPFVYETTARPLSYSARKPDDKSFDEPGRSRTHIDLFRRQALCPLSYRPGTGKATERFELSHCCVRNSRSASWSYVAVWGKLVGARGPASRSTIRADAVSDAG